MVKIDIEKLNFLNKNSEFINKEIIGKINYKVASDIFSEMCAYYKICPVCGEDLKSGKLVVRVKHNEMKEIEVFDTCPNKNCEYNKTLASEIEVKMYSGH